jgi:hypothetical protein
MIDRHESMEDGMAREVAHSEARDASALIWHLHRLVTRGPWDLDIAQAMSGYGYDEVKWAEGQVVLAELVNGDLSVGLHFSAALRWYEEAASVARMALANQPRLLARLGMN